MKKTGLTFVSLTIAIASISQALFTYGTHPVSKDEFVKAFNKNPSTTTDRKKALQEYLDLYINFKLKVQAAYDEGLDKDPTQQYELQNFKQQIADNVINEQANVKELVKEAFDRSQREIHVAQVFIEVSASSDTAGPSRQIKSAYEALKGGRRFEDITAEYSSDYATKKAKGDLGYIGVFTLPYEIENAIFALQPGQYSMPVKTKLGYHIFKNLGERKPLGSRRVAQILIAFPPDATAEEKAVARHKADSLYNVVSKGGNFGDIARNASNDLSTSSNNGELPEFTVGTYDEQFENAAFSLTQAGQVTKPFETGYGVHIIKLLEAKPAPTDINDAATYAALQDKVLHDRRMEQSRKNLLNKILATIKYKPAVYKEADLFTYTDSALKNEKAVVKGVNANTVLFSFAKQNIKASDWVKFVKASRPEPVDDPAMDYKNLIKDFLKSSAEEYYRNHLDEYNSSYGAQVKEFKDANLLFAIMEKKIWGKANSDSTGLANYYSEHKTKYTWSPSADALIITANNQHLVDSVKAALQQNIADWRNITAHFESNVIADSGRYELGQLPVAERTRFTKGLYTEPVKNDNDGSYSFNYIFNLYEQPAQRSFDDARGMVISDYQQVLEDNWIKELRKKYPVVVNQPVFATIK